MMVHVSAVRLRRGVQHHEAMDGEPLAAPTAPALARRGMTTPPADAATARMLTPLRGDQRAATARQRATRRAGAAAAVDAASSTSATIRGATCGGCDRSGADTGGKLVAVGAGAGVAATATAAAAAARTKSGLRPRGRYWYWPPSWSTAGRESMATSRRGRCYRSAGRRRLTAGGEEGA